MRGASNRLAGLQESIGRQRDRMGGAGNPVARTAAAISSTELQTFPGFTRQIGKLAGQNLVQSPSFPTGMKPAPSLLSFETAAMRRGARHVGLFRSDDARRAGDRCLFHVRPGPAAARQSVLGLVSWRRRLKGSPPNNRRARRSGPEFEPACSRQTAHANRNPGRRARYRHSHNDNFRGRSITRDMDAVMNAAQWSAARHCCSSRSRRGAHGEPVHPGGTVWRYSSSWRAVAA